MPHLDRWQKSYAEAGLVVVAINAYDEPRELVEEYVRRNRPGYSVYLDGKTLAEHTFFAPSFPYQLWVDREGKIVHRCVGFHLDEVAANEAKLRALLD